MGPLPGPVRGSRHISLHVENVTRGVPRIAAFARTVRRSSFGNVVVVSNSSGSPARDPVRRTFRSRVVTAVHGHAVVIFSFRCLYPREEFRSG